MARRAGIERETDQDDHAADARIDQKQAEMRAYVRTACEEILTEAAQDRHSVMTSADVRDFMIKGLSDSALDQGNFASKEEEIRKVPEMIDHALKFARETTALGERILRAVKDAKGEDLSDGSMKRWLKRLKERKSGEDFVAARRRLTDELLVSGVKALRAGWSELRGKLNEVKAKAAALGVTGKTVPALAALESKKYMDAKQPERLAMIEQAMQALDRREKSWGRRPERETEGSRFFAKALSFLMGAARGPDASLARVKVGAWLKKIFQGRSLAQAQAYYRDTVVPYERKWRSAREEYDVLSSQMKTTGTPRGFSPVASEEFLMKSYDQRLAYNRMLESRLSPEGKSAVQLTDSIWNALDQKDWYDAERLIGFLETQFPSHRELGPMVRFLATHRSSEDEAAEKKERAEMTDEQINAEVNQFIGRYPWLRVMLLECIEKDTRNPQDQCGRTRLIARMLYNLVWAEQRGFTSEREQEKDIHDERYKERTKTYIEEGHSKELEKNMVWGDTADELAIREDCTTAQIINVTTETDSQMAVVNAIDNRNLWKKERFGYWSDLKVVGMPLSSHHEFVEPDSRRLKWLMWQMHDRKMIFTGSTKAEYHKNEGKDAAAPAPLQPKTTAHHGTPLVQAA